MINNEISRSDYVYGDAGSAYPIVFEYHTDEFRIPMLTVSNGDTIFVYGADWVLSSDGLSVVFVDGFAGLENGQAFYIERAVKMVQESDYQIGRIDPEQIEKDFDRSVERDQFLLERTADNKADISLLSQRADEIASNLAQEIQDRINDVANLQTRADEIANNLAQETQDRISDVANLQSQIDNIDPLPSQAGHQGEFLTTDGTTANWASIPVPTRLSQLENDMNYVAHDDVVAMVEPVSTALSQEVQDRINDVANLQSQIDDIDTSAVIFREW